MTNVWKAKYAEQKKAMLKQRREHGLCYCGNKLENTKFKSCADCRQKQRKKYKKKAKSTICARCPNQVTKKMTICKTCMNKRKERAANDILEGNCNTCGKPKEDSPYTRCIDCHNKARERKIKKKERALKKGFCSRCYLKPSRPEGKTCEDCFLKKRGKNEKIFKGEVCACGEKKEANVYACEDCKKIVAIKTIERMRKKKDAAFKKCYCLRCCSRPMREDGTTCQDCYEKRITRRDRIFKGKICSCGNSKRISSYACSRCKKKINKGLKRKREDFEEWKEQLIAEEMLVDEFY